MEQIKRQKHSEEFKHEAVNLILLHGYSITEAARNLGINASQYCSNVYQAVLNQHGIVCSMSRKGNCRECVACPWYNAVMKRFFHSLKSEQAYFMRYQTPEEAKKDIIDYIEMLYNSNRAHSYLGYLSPNEYERVQHQLPMAA